MQRFGRVARFGRAAILCLAGVGSCGCTGDEARSLAPSPADAREFIRQGLAAWKEGKTQDLSTRSEPFRFVDPDLARKARLIEFQIQDSHQSIGHTIEIPATLELQDHRGKKRSQNAVYQVATEPSPIVTRSDP